MGERLCLDCGRNSPFRRTDSGRERETVKAKSVGNGIDVVDIVVNLFWMVI